MKKTVLFLLSLPFKLINIFYNLKNRQKKKILIYTDSRGIEITKVYNRRNPFLSYIGFFIKNYNVDYVIMPESHTTFIDFLYEWESKYKNIKYDYVILHLGIVDFSPRPLSSSKKIQDLKNSFIKNLFYKNLSSLDKNIIYNVEYNTELTCSLYSKDFLKKYILQKLIKIDNLILIGSNHILENWIGNYNKKRPANINIIQEYNKVLVDNLQKTVDISHWDEVEIRKYTVDNIHLSSVGFGYIENELNKFIIQESK